MPPILQFSFAKFDIFLYYTVFSLRKLLKKSFLINSGPVFQPPKEGNAMASAVFGAASRYGAPPILSRAPKQSQKRDRRRAGGPVSFPPWIFICSKMVAAAGSLISHKPGVPAGLRAVCQSSGFMVGKSSTSRMEALSVSSITSRSTPKPSPPVGGIPYSRAVT